MSNRALLAFTICLAIASTAHAQRGQRAFTPEDIAKLSTVTNVAIAPGGDHIAYVRSVQRRPGVDEDGQAWTQLHVITDGASRPFVTGEVNVSSIAWRPDGRQITFIAKLGTAEHSEIYTIPIDGGESRHLVEFESDVRAYAWRPDGEQLAFLARAERDEKHEELRKKGFKQKIYEEDYRPIELWLVRTNSPDAQPTRLDLEGSIADLAWSPNGRYLAVRWSQTPLVDDDMMFSRISLIDAHSGEIVRTFPTVGKLGRFEFSPDSNSIAIVGVRDIHDPREGRIVVAQLEGEPRIFLNDYEGHVKSFAWRDNNTILFVGHESCGAALHAINTTNGNIETLRAADSQPLLRSLSFDRASGRIALLADAPNHPREVFQIQLADPQSIQRLTNSNPWLRDVRLSNQEVVTHTARDGLKLQGVLIHPLDRIDGNTYPLVMLVHGGPEAHISNGWNTSYNRPGQALAARGFAVFYPNYRGSTARGVEFSMLGQNDYAGKEFDDIVDAKNHLVDIGLVDPQRCGISGGSYGGYATAWGATKQTEHWQAGVMFVGVSEQFSKFGTTDIPMEMYLVHARVWPWEDPEFFRRTSPIAFAPQARTPLLILHGEDDTRVHMSQSMTMYRYLKTLANVPVRLVLYPGEGHGNRNAAARYDYSLRMIRWMEHYLTGDGDDPPPITVEYNLATFQVPQPLTGRDDRAEDNGDHNEYHEHGESAE